MSYYEFDHIVTLDLRMDDPSDPIYAWCDEFIGSCKFSDAPVPEMWAVRYVPYYDADSRPRKQLIMQFAREEDATMFALRWK